MELTTEQQGLIDQANELIFNLGINDASLAVSKINASIGLGKILYFFEQARLPSKGMFCLFTPDGGITRNKGRWYSGFSYGCLLRWPSPEECGFHFIFPEIKPNACGMLVAKIDKIVPKEELYNRLNTLNQNALEINGRKILFNLGISNHFIEVCKVIKSNTTKIKENDCVVLFHTSPSELKKELYDFEMLEDKGGKWINTPLGRLMVLEGNQAHKYYESYKHINEFGCRKRQIIAEKTCGSIEIISNQTHQGLFDQNEARLGLYKMEPGSDELYPMTFRWDIKNYLIKPKQNINKENLEKLDIYKRACNLEIDNQLANVNVLPHGGGYSIPFPAEKWSLFHANDRRFFRLNNGRIDYSFSLSSELPYTYRGTEILDRSIELNLGEIAAELEQIYTFRY